MPAPAGIREEITIVNKEIEKHIITYMGEVCSVVYKRRFEDDLFSAGRWYVIGTFQTEGSKGRNTIRIGYNYTKVVQRAMQALYQQVQASNTSS